MRTVFFLAAFVAALASATAQDLVWPTPHPALFEGRAPADYVQPTESGTPESGMFGCGRSSGRQFHEGLDLKALKRDRRGDPTDMVVAVAPGTVLHVNRVSGLSNYGRYVVIEHPGLAPSVITLYAHLATVADGLQPGGRVEAGTALGLMGNSSSSGFPRARAHLHLEMGFWLGRGFEAWYRQQKFPSRNEHGLFNGMNIVGFDFLEFMQERKRGRVADLRGYLQSVPVAATVVVKNPGIPDFVQRYPELLQGAPPAAGVAGWRIDFAWFGLPKAWWPLDENETRAVREPGTSLVFHDRDLLRRHPCQSLVRMQDGAARPGKKMQEILEIIFTAAPRG